MLGCCLYRELQWAAAAAQFAGALQAGGFSPEVAYSLAVCQYQQRDFVGALATISDIVELGVHEHPELGVGSAADGLEASGRACGKGGAGWVVRCAAAHSPTTHKYAPPHGMLAGAHRG